VSNKDSLRVLVVDDMSTSRGILQNTLESYGIRNVFTEADANAGLNFMLRTPVHLIISDYNMPGKNGLEFLKAIRTNKQTARVGFILVSGSSSPDIIRVGRSYGMNNFLPKPFNTDSLRKTVEAVVGKL